MAKRLRTLHRRGNAAVRRRNQQINWIIERYGYPRRWTRQTMRHLAMMRTKPERLSKAQLARRWERDLATAAKMREYNQQLGDSDWDSGHPPEWWMDSKNWCANCAGRPIEQTEEVRQLIDEAIRKREERRALQCN